MSEPEARAVFASIQQRFPRLYSVGLQEEYGIIRDEYLRFAWDIDPNGVVEHFPKLDRVLDELSARLFVLSDAPRIWVSNVLEYLGIERRFEACFSGTSLNRKKRDGLFRHVMNGIGVAGSNCLMVGDERDTDILPAKREGIVTVYVGKEVCPEADYHIGSVMSLPELIRVGSG
jgi:FMN phosphatase YigB (HAD superfamily)